MPDQYATEHSLRGIGWAPLSTAARLGSLAGGGALALYGVRRRDGFGLALAVIGSALMLRGTIDKSRDRSLVRGALRVATRTGRSRPTTVARAVSIDRPREEVYAFFRNFANLPKVMTHLVSVRIVDARTSHWMVRAPDGGLVEWYAVIEDEQPDVRLTWRTLQGADIPNSGVVSFCDAPGGRGTDLHVELTYAAPGGAIGRLIARLAREEPGVQLSEDLGRLKQLLETGEIARNKMHPAC
jgi:uncharacterized membrane protein